MAFTPLPCPSCGSTGGQDPGQADVERQILCDLDAEGNLLGTALMVQPYDGTGAPIGAPTPVDPATGEPYVPQGTLQPCAGDTGCAPPTQFCFTTTTTGPVEHPGRTYDIELPINPGFAVESLQVDATNYPANITWAVTDADGAQFATALQGFLAGRFPDQTVTVNNPNAGTPVCGQALPMQVHIECARIDGTPPAPDLVELIYNGGRDLVVNPAYLTTPPTNLNGPQFVYLRRQDAGGTLNCTNIANQGWETNDLGDGNRDFEIWGQGPGGLQTIQDTTPTPRGTPVQEITADINDTGTGPTIWQTFTVPAAGTLKAVLVHGARDNGEQHRITLSTGDTDDNQVGDIINNVTNPPQVTNAGGGTPGPWTTFEQDVALGAGVYTFAISTTNPVGPNRGGLFTDMRVYVDSPEQHATAVTDDETCTVTTEETVTTTTCEYWQPRCLNGDIVSWRNVADGEELTNAEFWGQAPAPSCCSTSSGGGTGGSVSAGNLTNNYTVCAVVGGIPQTVERVVITDQSGGVIAQTFVGADGGPVTPSSYTIGTCGDPDRDTEIVELCDVLPGGAIVPFIRVEVYNAQSGAFIESRNEDGTGGIYNPTGTVTTCSAVDTEQQLLCDDNGSFIRVYTRAGGAPVSVNDLELDGVTPYAPVGDVVSCGPCGGTVLGNVCVASTDFPGVALPAVAVQACDDTVTYLNPATGEPWPNTTGVVVCPPDNVLSEQVLCDAGNGNTPFRRIYNLTPLGSVVVGSEDLDGNPYVVVGPEVVCGDTTVADTRDAEVLILCDSTPTRFLRKYLYDGETGAFTTVVDTALDGTTPFAPVGAVGVCTNPVQSDFDFAEEILCDANGTQFIRRFRFNSNTGVLDTTTNLTLAGAAFVPVGAVSVCANCCPVVIGEGCYNAGSGRYTAIRAANGTITLIDSVTGAAVAAANIVPCAGDDLVKTLTAQHRLIGDADAAWTPGADVAGTLTSVTYTVLSGTATVTDQSGTVAAGLPPGLTATWTAEDDNTLSGPQSIDAIGGQVYVNWTQR